MVRGVVNWLLGYSTLIELLQCPPPLRYLIDIRWMKQWKMFVGYNQWDQSNAGVETANPGPIDNSNLFKGWSLVVVCM